MRTVVVMELMVRPARNEAWLAGASQGRSAFAGSTVYDQAIAQVELPANSHTTARSIKTTAEHPFFVAGQNEFVPAGELQVGDLLISHDDQLIEVTEVRSTDEVTTVNILRVADHHTYFVGGTIWAFDVSVHNTSYLKIQKSLAVLTAKVRNELINDPKLLEKTLRPREIDAIVAEPWTMRKFFGTAVQRRVEILKNNDPLLKALKPTRGNAPQDFILHEGNVKYGYDIKRGSLSSMKPHYARPQINALVTYDSITADCGYAWKKKLGQ